MLYILATSTCKKKSESTAFCPESRQGCGSRKGSRLSNYTFNKKNNKKIFKPFRFRILNLSHEKNTYHEKNNNYLNKFNIVKNKTNIKNDFTNLIFKLRQSKPQCGIRQGSGSKPV